MKTRMLVLTLIISVILFSANLHAQITHEDSSIISYVSPVIADADNDGLYELMIGSRGTYFGSTIKGGDVYKFDNISGSPNWKAGIPSDQAMPTAIAVGNLDLDSDNEIVIANTSPSDVNSNGRVTVWDHSGGNDYDSCWSMTVSEAIHDLAIGDCDNDGENELIISYRYYQRKIEIYERVSACDYQLSKTISTGRDMGDVIIADCDGNGSNEIVITANVWGTDVRIYRYQSSDYQLIWSYTFDSGAPYTLNADVTVGDADNDGYNEIVVGVGGNGTTTNRGLYVFKHDTGDNWTIDWSETGVDFSVWFPFVGDVCNDGSNKIVFQVAGEDTLSVYHHTGSIYEELTSFEVAEGTQYIYVGDVDNDSDNEVVVAGKSINSYSVECQTPEPAYALHFPSFAQLPCDDDCISQSVAITNDQPITGATIPVRIPEFMEYCGISVDGLYTQDWNVSVFLNIDTSEISVGLLNFSGDSIPAGVTTVFNIMFKAEPECQTRAYIHWDTCMFNTSLELHFSDMNHNLLNVSFDAYIDSSEILGYTPGDVCEPLDGQVLVNDLVCLVDYLFKGGPAPCVMAAADVSDGNCQLYVNDLTYLVDYLFKGGADPNCGCTAPPAIAKLNSDISISSLYENGITTISINSEIDLKGVHLTLSGDKVNGAVSLIDHNIELIAETNTIGILDLEGEYVISAGEYDILQLEGEYEIVEAIASDKDHNAIILTAGIGNNGVLPHEFTLDQNYPNPFNPTTEIGFSLSNAGNVMLDIFNIKGQRVVRLIDGHLDSGEHSVQWDSKGNNGHSVSSGIYFYKLTTDEFVDTKKMILLK